MNEMAIYKRTLGLLIEWDNKLNDILLFSSQWKYTAEVTGCIPYEVINDIFFFLLYSPMWPFFKELKPKQGSKSRLLVYDELLQLGGDNVNICR